jgi:2-alkyl-3-oxoalkanoate reductase
MGTDTERCGFYYGPGTLFHPDGTYADKLRRQELPIIGAGSGVWSWVHVEDAALATAEITWRGKTVYTSMRQEPLQLRTNGR